MTDSARGKVWATIAHVFYPMALLRLIIRKVFTRAMISTTPHAVMTREATTENNRKLVVGLGNPGKSGSRHSVGMAVLAALGERLGGSDSWRSDRHVSGEIRLTRHQDTQIILLRPKLLMNVNGVSVAKAAQKFVIQPENVILVHDELDKPLGKFGIKHGGSASYVVTSIFVSGHNGVRSCVDCLQTDVMPRLRIGIGRPSGKVPIDRFVLGRFTQEEQVVLDTVMRQSVDVLLAFLTDPQYQTSPAEGSRAKRRRPETTELQKKI